MKKKEDAHEKIHDELKTGEKQDEEKVQDE